MPRSVEDRFRERGLAGSSRDTYRRVLGRADKADPAKWAREKADGAPTGTILPMRAAVKHLLVSERGLSDLEAEALLPPSQGRPARMRHALGRRELDLYYAEVAKVRSWLQRTLFALLPRTGMRIGEALALRVRDIDTKEGRRGLLVLGKGSKERFIPLSPGAAEIIDAWLPRLQKRTGETFGKNTLLFDVSGEAVRKILRRIRESHPELGRLTPHVLRHTFATTAISKGVNIRILQAALGHANIATTAIYTHPSITMIGEAVDKVDNDSK